MAVSSRSYQSQTFRRLMAGSSRLSRWGRRQLLNATRIASWSLQVVLYPVYVGFQTTRLVYRRLRASTIGSGHPPWFRFLAGLGMNPPGDRAAEAPAPDTPIRYLMATLQGSAPKDKALAVGSPLPLRLTRQGRAIACNLADQAIVLVGRQAQVIPLDSAQQIYLQELIAWILTDYAYRWYRYHWREQLQLPLPPAAPQPLAWRPVRQFHRLMGWMQQATVAVAINLFQESYWLPTPVEPFPDPHPRVGPVPLFRELSLPWRRHDPTEESPSSSLVDQQGAALVPNDPPPAPVETLTLTSPDWVDTEFVLVGYVDHPLVAVLRWVDQVLLWLEAKARHFWRRVRF
ncbi:hypothetical protein C7271_08095 [filamentous cyanobacterium CCP5]|nr:hypothetical protein C7271_08095 [filamentous cyanobacterium CCP5]